MPRSNLRLPSKLQLTPLPMERLTLRLLPLNRTRLSLKFTRTPHKHLPIHLTTLTRTRSKPKLTRGKLRVMPRLLTARFEMVEEVASAGQRDSGTLIRGADTGTPDGDMASIRASDASMPSAGDVMAGFAQ